MNTAIKTDMPSTEVSTTAHVLQSALKALGEGRIGEVIDAFGDDFTFSDQALALQFTDKERLSEFFLKGRELFPDMALEVVSTFSCEEYVIAEWKVTGTETLSYGSLRFRFPISYQGTSIVRIENEGITSWSDYYDQNTSRRFRLGAFFTEWIEY
jgi:2-phospho-L-lactate guanylyltransferase (CobY/MobA/RfbA family)